MSSSGIDTDLLGDLGLQPTNALEVLELDLPGTNIRRAVTWASSSTAPYDKGIVKAMTINRSSSDESFNLPRDTSTVTVEDDANSTLEKLLMANPSKVYGSVARVRVASTVRAQSKWFTVFKGIVDKFQRSGAREWTFTLRPDDRALQRLVKIPYIQPYDWPNAPAASLGRPAHVAYGTHLSTGTRFTGPVPVIYVDTVNFRYVVSFGLIAGVSKVFVDTGSGPVESDPANWTFNGAFFNRGKWWSILEFNSDQGEDAIVTVDCEGITDGGLITNPATQLEHFLTNFVFADWGAITLSSSSSWINIGAFNIPIDETFFAEVETFLSNKKIASGGRVIDATRKGIDVFQEWCAQWHIRAFWTYGANAGKLAIRPKDHGRSDYTTSPHFDPGKMPNKDFIKPVFDPKKVVDEIQTESVYSSAEPKGFQKPLSVKDPSKGYDAAVGLKLEWQGSEAVN